ncbi:alpha/beta-hydrolase [Nemania sp. FL0916]|nr:alpha/beta-hydrolase [Nemania sp. FL0916]
MASEIEEPAVVGESSTAAEEIKTYRVHVSSRYLKLTKQKLELSRLPHELSEPTCKDWWQPKPLVEPLIDFWLEQYQWREQEEILNSFPQFRTSFKISGSDSPMRLQFLHARSPRTDAVPLLLIPPFPFSSLSMGHLIKLFTEPDEAAQQAFHLVIPSLPGLGFSDSLPTNSAVISLTAHLLDSLMKRLGYRFYLATNAGAGASSPGQIDYKLAEWLSTEYPESCLGTHLISPPLSRPRPKEAPIRWAKWSVAKFFKSPVFGYRSEDLSALKRQNFKMPTAPARPGFTDADFYEPNTLAYALCDSPTGLLVSVMKALRLIAPGKEFTPTEIINFTQIAWLPGPEAAMRFWGYCSCHPETPSQKGLGKPHVGITVFVGHAQNVSRGNSNGNSEADSSRFKGGSTSYSCPAWAKTQYKVLYTNRVEGEPGLLALERPEIIAAGTRGLAAAVLKIDKRLRPPPEIALESAPGLEPAPASGSVPTSASGSATASTPGLGPIPSVRTSAGPEKVGQGRVSSDTQSDNSLDAMLKPPPAIGDRLMPIREASDDTKVASNESLIAKTPSPIPTTPSPA